VSSRARGLGYRLVRVVAVLLLWLFYRRIETIHAERIPATGPVVIAANHHNALVDAMLIVASVPRRITPLAKAPLFRHPLIGPFLRLVGAVRVHRRVDGADPRENAAMFAAAVAALRAGGALLIFPEGTRSRDGSLQKPRDGLAMLALRTGATIVPIGVSDTDKVWPRDRKPRPWPGGHVTVRIGTPFRVSDEIPADLDRKTAKSRATDVIMRRIAALLPDRQRGAYA